MTTPRKTRSKDPSAVPEVLEGTSVQVNHAQTPDNDRVTEAIRAVLASPAAPSHAELTSWAVCDVLITLVSLQESMQEAHTEQRIRIAREIASLHKALYLWSADPQGQIKANPLTGK